MIQRASSPTSILPSAWVAILKTAECIFKDLFTVGLLILLTILIVKDIFLGSIPFHLSLNAMLWVVISLGILSLLTDSYQSNEKLKPMRVGSALLMAVVLTLITIGTTWVRVATLGWLRFPITLLSGAIVFTLVYPLSIRGRARDEADELR